MWVTHLIAATGFHADEQGPISSHAPGDKRDNRAHPHDVHGRSRTTHPDLTTTSSISGATSGSALASSTPTPVSTTSSDSGTTSGSAFRASTTANSSPGTTTGHCSDTAPTGSTSPGPMRSTTSSSSPTPLHNRLATIEASLRLQDATGTSHLQQLEINPEAYGVAKSSRSHIKRLRLQRNRALHGATKPAEKDIILSTPPSARPATKPREVETMLSTFSVAPATKPPEEEIVLSTPSTVRPAAKPLRPTTKPLSPAAKPREEETVLSTPSSAAPTTKPEEEETVLSTPSTVRLETKPKQEKMILPTPSSARPARPPCKKDKWRIYSAFLVWQALVWSKRRTTPSSEAHAHLSH